jgi:hypothetical protein
VIAPPLSVSSKSFYFRLQQATLFLVLCSLMLLVVFPAKAQFSGPATGTPAFGSFTGGPDIINLGNLNIHIAIPILSKPGRGIPYQYSLVYDSSVWNAQGTWQPTTGSVWGWQAGPTQVLSGYLQGNISLSKCGAAGSTTYIYHFTNISLRSPDGLTHSFSGAAASLNQCTRAQTSAQGSSGDGYYVNAQINPGPDSDGVADAVITTPSGDMLNSSLEGLGKVTGSFNQGVTDTNGNHLGPSVGVDGNPTAPVYDTMGLQPLKISWSPEYYNQQYLPTGFTYTDANGKPQTITVNYGSFTIQTNFGDTSIGEYSPVTQNLPTSIVFPDFVANLGPDTCQIQAQLTIPTIPDFGPLAKGQVGGHHSVIRSPMHCSAPKWEAATLAVLTMS